MADFSQEDLDRLFQRGMEQQHFEYNPAAWSDMEVLLDRRRRRRFFLLIFWTALGIGLGLLLWYRFVNFEKRPAPDGQETASHAAARTSQPGVAYDTFSTTNSALPEAHFLAPASNRPAAGKTAADENDRVFRVAVNPGGPERDSTGDAVAIDSGIAEPEYTEELPALKFQSALNPLPLLELALDHSEIVPLPISPQPQPFGPVKTEKRADDQGLGLAVAGGVEWNAVGLSPFDSMGWRVGLLMEYRFRKHWAVSSGIFYAKRNYGAGAGEYQTPYPGYWTDDIQPVATKGHCNMLEVPLQLNYYPRANNTSGWVFGAGAQAYWVLEEDYYYYYDKHVPGQLYWWYGQKTGHAIPGFAFASAGYQWTINHESLIELSPFVQAPLKGMGHGEIALYSFGLNARVRFLWK